MAGILNGTKGVVIVFCTVGAIVYAVSGSGNGPAVAPSSANASTAPVQVASAQPATSANDSETPPAKESAKAASEWTYDQNKDELRNQMTVYATLDSANKLEFGFPYGESGAEAYSAPQGQGA